MKKIILTQGQFALVNDEDFEKVNQFKWCADKYKDTFYAHRRIESNKNSKKIYMHRFIMGASKGFEVDHINGNGLDNRQINLRVCTHKQNIINQKMRKDNTSGYKGVSLSKKYKYPRWRANIGVDGRQKFLGYYSNPEKAYKAYCSAAREIFGEFVRL